MKNILYISKKVLGIILMTVIISSCQSKIDELRPDPNAVNDVDDAGLFVNAARSLFLETKNESVHRFSGQHAHYFVGGGDLRKPDLYGDGFDVHYNIMLSEIYSGYVYGGIITNIQEVLELTSSGEYENKVRHAMADVIAVMGFAVLTDEFGDIPYTEGGKGKLEGILTPKYDSQEYIYKDFIKRLGENIEVLKTLNADNGYFESDFIFNNDSDKWVRFANSVRMRMAMRIRNADETLSRETVKKCLSEPLMEDTTHDAFMIQTEYDTNSWYALVDGTPKIKMSDMFVSQLKNTGDPRLKVFIAKSKYGQYIGQLNGLTDEEFGKSFFSLKSAMGKTLASPESKMYIMTAAETWLLRAEAALAYSTGEDANSNYRKGIETSMQQWNISASEINSFLATSTADLSDPEDDESQIGTQLWIALTPDYFQGWCSIRRSGYPVIEQRTDPKLAPGVTDGYVPERFKYSSFELSSNGVNVQEAIDRQGPNSISTPLWWSKRKK